MDHSTWKDRVETALGQLQKDRWTTPAVRYMEIIDDIAAGNGSATDIARRHGSPDLVVSALSHVTTAMHGNGSAPPLEEGGWYERDGEGYRVAPEFVAYWVEARDLQRQIQAFQAT